jgi:hypothetical protein
MSIGYGFCAEWRRQWFAEILYWNFFMKALGFILLFAGFAIVLSAFVLLSTNSARTIFVLSGVAVQLLGLVLSFRAHYTLGEGR